MFMLDRGVSRQIAKEAFAALDVRGRRYLYLSLLGLCQRCSLPKSGTGTLCDNCKDVSREGRVARQAERRSLGLCVNCRKESASYRCPECQKVSRRQPPVAKE